MTENLHWLVMEAMSIAWSRAPKPEWQNDSNVPRLPTRPEFEEMASAAIAAVREHDS